MISKIKTVILAPLHALPQWRGAKGGEILSAMTVSLLFFACNTPAPDRQIENTRIVTDMAGRQVKIPEQIASAFVDRHSIQMVYAFDTILPVNRVFNYNDTEKRFLKKSFYENKPYVLEDGIEEIIRLKPDVLLCSQLLTPDNIEAADKLQERAGIPVILMNTDILKYKETLAFLGGVLNKQEKADELIAFINKYIDPIVEKAGTIPAGQKKRVYYAEGMKGANTDPSGSVHSLLIDLLGGVNVAEAEVLPGKGMTGVSPEQVYAWNPDIVLVWSGNFDGMDSYRYIKTGNVWKNLKAVRENRVYQVPWKPFGWIDRPPGINRLIGIVWLSKLFYPELYADDILPVVQEFFRKFYHYDMSGEEALQIMNPQPEI
ncbi:MAG: ABC transporter substrate-binding protein [Prevotella sp.]|jgi:iron complex transport system substrate-binding protein|nr:ABC transporter substrate-binding protein [Prevotella sp.]